VKSAREKEDGATRVEGLVGDLSNIYAEYVFMGERPATLLCRLEPARKKGPS